MPSASPLRPLVDDDRAVVERLWQLYSHDMSGLFKAGRLPTYFEDPDRTGFLIVHEDAPAGFAFLWGLSTDQRSMGDFFVVRAARRMGVGYAAARELLARHPGRWEIGFQAANAGAPEFWRRVVSDAVGDAWREDVRPVPGKPHVPHDHFLVFSVS